MTEDFTTPDGISLAVHMTLKVALVQVKELSETHDNIIPNFGLHPW